MNKINYNNVSETVYNHTLPNGLRVFFVPKNGYNKTYVTLTTPFGSNITDFSYNDEVHSIPNGVAHFLEHKLFEKNGKDVSEEFSLNSARVNAYTTNSRTTYLFSCTDHLHKNIHTLCDFVLNPQFTEEGIQKEIGIITQEINMYKDDPNAKSYMGLLKNMYPNHNVSIDILGSVESINTINKDILTNVHKAFYNPHQMVLFITGKVDVEDTINYLESLYNNPTDNYKPVIITKDNTKKKDTKNSVITHDVLQSNALLGIKLPRFDYNKESFIKTELILAIYSEILFGKGTKTYQSLLEKGLINDTFGTDITLEEDYSFMLIGTNTFDEEEFYQNVRSIINKSLEETPSQEKIDRILKQITGGFITALNSLEYIANQYTKYFLHHTNLFDMLDVAKSITIYDIKEYQNYFKDESNYYEFTIKPKKKD